jgi:hypothetical protein
MYFEELDNRILLWQIMITFNLKRKHSSLRKIWRLGAWVLHTFIAHASLVGAAFVCFRFRFCNKGCQNYHCVPNAQVRVALCHSFWIFMISQVREEQIYQEYQRGRISRDLRKFDWGPSGCIVLARVACSCNYSGSCCEVYGKIIQITTVPGLIHRIIGVITR